MHGCCLQTIRFSPEPGREAHLRGALTSEAQSLAHQRGLCAAHLLIADQDRSRAPTRETALRAGPDTVADWVLLVEGYDEAAVAQDRSGLLQQSGAGPEITRRSLQDGSHLLLRRDVRSLNTTSAFFLRQDSVAAAAVLANPLHRSQ